MREIKFRAWDKEFMKMSIPMQLFTNGQAFFFFQGIGTRCCCHENIVTMQYTGLKDKNSKEIYEGDYLVVNTNDGGDNIETSRTEGVFEGVVRFIEGTYTIDTKGDGNPEINLHLSNEFYEAEVIGNIYENPELLKVNDEN